ncbi:MAG: amidohydrolase [Oscillospiraceae bacterium]|nr:amidohydrolase [Oscillospiraceae bacterium]
MIRFYNGKTLRFDGGAHLTADEVWTDGGEIVYVGAPGKEKGAFEREIDLGGDVLMPGFKNAHTHTAMVFLRSLADDMPLDRWLSEQVWPNEAKLDEEAVYDLTRLGILEYLSSGITASFDMYVKNEANARANIDSGFRTVLCAALNNFDKDVENIEREYQRFNALDPLVSYRLGIHAEYTTSIERIEYAASLAEKYREGCFTHLSETRAEVQACVERYGLTPPQLLDRLGFFRYGGGGFHCCHMSGEDIALFAEKKLWAITNPASNLKLASGAAPIERMRKAGVPLAIGTDGAGSNNALDMFREMYLVTALQKLATGDAAACPAECVLEMACVGGARAMGLDDCTDVAPGKKADLVVLDLQRPNMQPENNLVKNIVYAGSKENVRLTMVNGRVLYERGEFFVGESAERIYGKANAFIRKIRQL